MPRANWDVLKEYHVVVPESSVLSLFNSEVLSSIQLMRYLVMQNKKLEEARDILLPRLMTGMIDVEELDVEHAQLNKEANDPISRVESTSIS